MKHLSILCFDGSYYNFTFFRGGGGLGSLSYNVAKILEAYCTFVLTLRYPVDVLMSHKLKRKHTIKLVITWYKLFKIYKKIYQAFDESYILI